ncbi:hypothetical protein BWQ96_01371 [Gracilariopsis chorda]|uniref:Uncharacterized protein n=1 Tax=Gracilariopsis chorda TaxID=448386 RepID=A0A2V3J351_9FLOR|nr:hypothetical protein BWQ96_01371 [Gracilariopsis chorda]|eukprot:PXF48815.1 hypothetical protein BWQ96_01371 [Gracilariopsis chorda]
MTALEHKQIHARYGVREQVALQVEFYLCVILAVRCIVTEHEVRAVRVAVLCAAIVAHVNGWRCKDSRLRRSVDTSGLAAGAVLPLSIGGMGQNYALIAAAGGAGTVALAGLGRVRMGGQMAVAGLMGVVAWWQGVGAGAMGVMSAVPILQAGLIRRLGVTFTAAEAGLVATGLAMSGLRACGKTESVEEGLLQAGLVGVVCGVAAVVECVRSRGGKGRRIVLAGMAVMAAYVKAWGVWRTEPVECSARRRATGRSRRRSSGCDAHVPAAGVRRAAVDGGRGGRVGRRGGALRAG